MKNQEADYDEDAYQEEEGQGQIRTTSQVKSKKKGKKGKKKPASKGDKEAVG